MLLLASLGMGLIGLFHLSQMILYMFLWKKPIGRRLMGLDLEEAEFTRPLAAQQGLYHGFLSAGLFWFMLQDDKDLKLFFLGFALIAGVFGGFKIKKTIFLTQALPALLVIALVYKAPEPKEVSRHYKDQSPGEVSSSEEPSKRLQIADTTFADCERQDVIGLRIRLKAYSCGANKAFTRLVVNPSVAGFDLESRLDGKTESRTVIRTFQKPQNTEISAALGEILTASKLTKTSSCTLKFARKSDDGQFDFFSLSPTGDLAKKWNESQVNGGETPPPCGPLGEDFAGEKYFFALPSRPEIVVFVDLGTEKQPFDISTIEPTAHDFKPILSNNKSKASHAALGSPSGN